MRPDPRTLPKRFGATVRSVRHKSGLTQMQLAEKADLSLNYIGEVERGEKLVSLETVFRVSHALGITGADMLKKAGI